MASLSSGWLFVPGYDKKLQHLQQAALALKGHPPVSVVIHFRSKYPEHHFH